MFFIPSFLKIRGQKVARFRMSQKYRSQSNIEEGKHTPQLPCSGKDKDDATPMFTENPYWDRYENISEDTHDRLFGVIGLNYTLVKGVPLSRKIKGNLYTLNVREGIAIDP